MISMENNLKMVSDGVPASWVYRYLPEFLWPYAQLARWERPIGWKLLMWPCWWSVMLAANSRLIENRAMDDPLISESVIWITIGMCLIAFAVGAFIMRGAGCTYNDLVDQNIDNKISRTKSRPLPSGRVSRKNAIIFLVLQLIIGLGILLIFNWPTIILGLASSITIITYPFMKRITWWPQLFLGFAFSWGALVGWTAITSALALPPVLLYLGCICWIIAYDTIYAHQDIEDDAVVGVKSTARLFAENTKQALLILFAGAWTFFAFSFWFADAPWLAWLGLALAGLHMAWQVKTFELDDAALSLKLFKSNSQIGWLLFLGLLAANII